MRVTEAGLALIHAAEACSFRAYLDSGGLPTIGWGTTRYPPWHLGGRKVQMGDVCTQEQADLFAHYDLERFEKAVDDLTVDGLLPRQNDALVCFTYNVGEGATLPSGKVTGYRGSRLRRLVNANPNDPAIRGAFMPWHKVKGKPIRGLWNRRHREADHYFGVITPRPPFPYPKVA